MKVKWKVETGFVDRMPARVTEIADEDLEGLNVAETEELINACIQEDFEQQITWSRCD